MQGWGKTRKTKQKRAFASGVTCQATAAPASRRHAMHEETPRVAHAETRAVSKYSAVDTTRACRGRRPRLRRADGDKIL